MKQIFNNLKLWRAGLIYCMLIILLFTFSSCKKFLDKPQTSQFSFITTVKDCQIILDNPNMYTQHPTDGQYSSDEYYLTDDNYDAQDESLRGFYIWSATAQRLKTGGNDWITTYTNVFNSNAVLEQLTEIADKKPALVNGDDFKLAKGMALFIRSNCFYQLAVQYAKPYNPTTANQDIGIPIRLTSDTSVPSSRATVQQTFDKIIQDLQEAVSLLPNTTSVPTRPGKVAVYALLARIYLYMEEYTLAGAAANSSLQIKSELLNYDSPAEVSKTTDIPFKRFNKEVLYHASINAIDPYYAKISDELLALYTDVNDLRKSIFFKENVDLAGTYYFKGSYSEDVYTWFNGLAVDEMYLVRAECYARANNPSAAMTDLNNLLRSRWKTGTYTDLPVGTKEQALSRILLERRKELVMRSLLWSDLKRLNKTTGTARRLTRSVRGVNHTLPPNDLRYQLLLPQTVIEFGAMPQNPR